MAACIIAAETIVRPPSNSPKEIPGCPSRKANSAPNGPTICSVAAHPVVTVALSAVRAASTNRRRVGASSLARNATADTGLVAPYRDHSRLAHAKRMVGIGLLKVDSNGKALIQSHPVERFFDIWEAADGSTVGLIESPADPFDLSIEKLPRVAQQRHVRAHSGTDST